MLFRPLADRDVFGLQVVCVLLLAVFAVVSILVGAIAHDYYAVVPSVLFSVSAYGEWRLAIETGAFSVDERLRNFCRARWRDRFPRG